MGVSDTVCSVTAVAGADTYGQMAAMHRRIGGAALVTVTGEVDLYSAPRLQAVVSEALADTHDHPVIVDLSAVELLAPAGLRALEQAHTSSLQHPWLPLRLVVNHARPVILPLQLAGLDVLDLYYDLNEALAANSPPHPGTEAAPPHDPGHGA